MNRTALGLAIGAGYVLGRTKKMKLAIAVGTMVAGKRMNLSPRALAEMVTTQLENNPQFKEIGDQLREDLRGVGKAASGALVERQIEGLAGRLHSRTQGVRDQISGVAPDVDDVRDAGRKATGIVPGARRGDDEAADDESYDDAYPEESSYDEDKDRDDASYDEAEDRDEAGSEDENRNDSGDGRRRRSSTRAGGSGGSGGSGGQKRAATERGSGKAPAKKKSAAGKATSGARSTAAKSGRAASGAAKGGRSRG
ncbi:DNA primase [Streptomyces sp. BH106]|uniref:DNA primase n=1 Tax=Streptomyces sp. BH106 TaxID=3410409 RepID=UPI003CF0C1D0